MSEPVEDFASLFEASQKAKRVEKGQTIEGTIVAIGAAVAFVDVGGKGEAMIDIAELKDADGAIEVAVGDRITALVVSTEGGLTLSRRLARGAATDKQLEEAYRAGLPVEGKVEQALKAGYEVRIGRTRAFCPASQIDTVRTADPAQHVGRVYPFRIIEYKEGGRNIIVSRRALLEEEQREKAVEVRRAIVPGATLTGRVVSVRDFGAFVDLGAGVQGLLHVSEMAWSRSTDTSQIIKAGETITVRVLRVDDEGQKISLGLKQLTADPWETVAERYAVGDVRPARVTRIQPFGAFVELEPGVEALAHVSTFPPAGRGGASWSQKLPVGTTAEFEILSLDLERKRIGVALVQSGAAEPAGSDAVVAEPKSAPSAATAAARIVPGAQIVGKVERHESFGVFVFLAPGRTALMPMSETGVARDGDVAKTLPVGSDVEVIVQDVDAATRRIRVSRKAVFEAREAEEVRDYNARESKTASTGFGSLADKLRGALKPSGE